MRKVLKRLFKINNLITLVAVATTIFVLYNTQEKELRVDCVPNEEVAIEIGKAICMKAFPEIDYDNTEWKCIYYEAAFFEKYEEDFWVVYCSDGRKNILGGGLPEIHIKRKNARIIDIGLAS